MITIDFETQAIGLRPKRYPPKPVGLAVMTESGEGRYLAWGHPSNNNCSWEDAAKVVGEIFASGEPILCHNAKFDVEIAVHWFGVPWPDPLKVFDSVFDLFLTDPHALNLQLKPSAARVLGLPPEERDLLQEWILRNINGATKKNWGEFICLAPVEIVGPYALGDCSRTLGIHRKLWPTIKSQNMVQAYEREQKLTPILVEAERRGIRVNLPLLEKDMEVAQLSLNRAELEIRNILNSPGLNVGSPAQLADALQQAQMINGVVRTAKGAISTAQDALRATVTNPRLLGLLLYRGALSTCLDDFGLKWITFAHEGGGRVHPQWNQVRGEKGAKFRGTRTGRLSSEAPNLTNPPNELDVQVPDGGYSPVPLMRKYLLPEEGHVWLKRDFSSQELRILAHYEDGALMKAYQENPDLDPHQMAREMIAANTGMDLPRRDVKIAAFSIVYGSGVTGLAQQLGTASDRARRVREAYMEAIPGIRVLSNNLRNRGRQGLPIRTLGGRMYYAEEPRLINGIMRSFEYKLLNYLIQPSAADQTKQSILDWDAGKTGTALFLAALHDEINASVPVDEVEHQMAWLKEAMEAPRLDVPVRSEGYLGPNFQDIIKCA